MDYRFREIRKGECANVLAFAKDNGAVLDPKALRHHLSLGAKKDGNFAAVALCIEQQPNQFVIQIVHREGVEQALITELADRCLGKVQSGDIALARISSPTESATQTIWKQSNWLDGIQETSPPSDEAERAAEAQKNSETSQAA